MLAAVTKKSRTKNGHIDNTQKPRQWTFWQKFLQSGVKKSGQKIESNNCMICMQIASQGKIMKSSRHKHTETQLQKQRQ